MQAASRTDVDIAYDRKSAHWKVWIVAELKRHTSAPSTWIAHKLNMGSPQLVGSMRNAWNERSSRNRTRNTKILYQNIRNGCFYGWGALAVLEWKDCRHVR